MPRGECETLSGERKSRERRGVETEIGWAGARERVRTESERESAVNLRCTPYSIHTIPRARSLWSPLPGEAPYSVHTIPKASSVHTITRASSLLSSHHSKGKLAVVTPLPGEARCTQFTPLPGQAPYSVHTIARASSLYSVRTIPRARSLWRVASPVMPISSTPDPVYIT